jgi:Uma2 family endonuclease
MSDLSVNGSIPPLRHGDRLTRAEFERRYDAMPNLKKAELLEGVVYMPSPVRWKHHGKPHFHVEGWLFNYEAATPGVECGSNATTRLDLDNEPQPDALMIISPECGGQVRISADDYVEGGPELAAEISASTARIDFELKFNIYRRNGVREYIIWDTVAQTVHWFVLRGDQYERLAPNAAGVLQSEVFPRLWLDPAALIRFDSAAVVAVLQQGIATPEHAAFVARLQAAREKEVSS